MILYHVVYLGADGHLHGGEYTQEQLIKLLQDGAIIDCAVRVKTDGNARRASFLN